MYRATNSDWQKLSTLGYQLTILVEAECPVHERVLASPGTPGTFLCPTYMGASLARLHYAYFRTTPVHGQCQSLRAGLEGRPVYV